MKKTLIFVIGFILAIVLGVLHKTFFQNKIALLENPFSQTTIEKDFIEEKTPTENSTTTSTTTAMQ